MSTWTNRNSYSLLVGRQNVTAILEDTFVVSYKTKHTLTIWSSTCVLWYLLKGVEHLCLYQNRHKDVYSSFIHNCQNLDAATMPFWRWMNKPGPYPDNGILFSTKKKWAVKSSWKDVEETNTYYQVSCVLDSLLLWNLISPTELEPSSLANAWQLVHLAGRHHS